LQGVDDGRFRKMRPASAAVLTAAAKISPRDGTAVARAAFMLRRSYSVTIHVTDAILVLRRAGQLLRGQPHGANVS
jgi:hypothetical protein